MDHDVAQRHRYSIELRIVAMQRCAFITGSLATNSTVRSAALSLHTQVMKLFFYRSKMGPRLCNAVLLLLLNAISATPAPLSATEVYRSRVHTAGHYCCPNGASYCNATAAMRQDRCSG